jgi:outer membrane receptor protein involved in Fe transport
VRPRPTATDARRAGHTNGRTLVRGAGCTALLLVTLAPRAAPQASPDGPSGRGPRFLLATARSPRPLDPDRIPVLRRRVSLDLQDVPLKAALTAITEQAGLELVYSDDVLPLDTKVRLRADDITVAAALTDVLDDAGVDVVFNANGRAALVPRARNGVLEDGGVRGRVTDAKTGQPIAGAGVTLEGTVWRATTDDNGQYHLTGVAAGTYTLRASRIGFAQASQAVTVTAGREATADFALRAAPTMLEQVVVTATKTEAKIQDVPAAVEVVDSAALANSGAKTVLEALRSVTGVTDASYGENFQSLQLRGLPRLGNENETVLLLIDGVPQTDSRNSARLTTMPIDNVDEIEVVKGPNSALYGRTAIGGVINFLTRDPPAKPEFRASVQSGAWDYVRVRANAGAPTDSLGSGYLVSWQGEQRQSALTPSPKRHESSIFGKVKQILDARTQLWVTANYASSLGGTPAPIPYDNGRLLSDVDPRFSLYSNLNLPYAAYNQDEVRVSAGVTRQVTPTTRVADVLGYRHFKYQFVNDGDCILFTPPDTTVLFPFSEVQQEDYYFDDLRVETTVNSGSVTQHVLAGGSFERNQGRTGGDIEYTDTVSFGVPVIYSNPQFPGVNQLLTQSFGPTWYRGDFYGLYLQDEVALAERWRLSAGARYDLNHLTAIIRAPAPTIHATYTKVSPKVGLSYRLLTGGASGGPELSLYGQYSRAFLPPRAPSGLTQADTIKLFPEDIRNWEGGVKTSLFGNRLAMELSVFDLDRNGIPIVVRVVAQAFKTVNGGEQKFSGVEFGLSARPTPLVTVFGKYAYYNGRYGTYRFNNNGTQTDLTGYRVALSPKHQWDLGLDLSTGGATVELEEHYKSSRYLNSFNTALLPAYFVTDGRVGWRWHRYVAALGVTNLFNEQYETDGDITYGMFAFPAPPRRLVVDLGATF